MTGLFSKGGSWDDFFADNDYPSVTIHQGAEISFLKAPDGWYDATVITFDKESCAAVLAEINNVPVDSISIVETGTAISM